MMMDENPSGEWRLAIEKTATLDAHHPEELEATKDHCIFVERQNAGILRGIYPERSRRAQNDGMRGFAKGHDFQSCRQDAASNLLKGFSP